MESLVWKDTNWKHIELRLRILQNNAARKNIISGRSKTSKANLNSYDFIKSCCNEVTTSLTVVRKLLVLVGILKSQ